MADVIDLSDHRAPDKLQTDRSAMYATYGVNDVGVRFFILTSDEPSLPWCSVTDLASALGLIDQEAKDFVIRVGARWLTYLKAVDTQEGKVLLVPFLGVVAILIQYCTDPDIDAAIIESAADAMDASLQGVPKSDRFQAMIVAARNAASPGDVQSLVAEVSA